MNKLTEKLLAQGYTETNYPEYVMIGGNAFDKSLDNYQGGFVYYGWYIYERTFITPCGMVCKGKFAHNGLSWQGTNYCYENDNPWIVCPKGEINCQLREEPFRSEGTGVLCRHCVVHETEREWAYEGSCEAERHLLDDEIRRKKTSLILQRNNHVCEEHMRYDEVKKEWEFNYDPMQCASGYCRAQSTDFKDGGFCPVLNKYLSKEKGNVFYDVKYSGRDYTKDGTLFEGERFEHVIKGRQLFNKPICLDIARVIAKLCQDSIRHKVRYNTRDYDSLTFFRAERGEIDFHWEILNIRAEKKAARDFEQDLEDIENGITVTHEFDVQKAKKALKHEKREAAKQQRIKQIENKILKEGWDNLEFIDRNRAMKLLDVERIDELDAEHEEQKNNKIEQMSIFDMIGTLPAAKGEDKRS